jgi:hypothetical protein
VMPGGRRRFFAASHLLFDFSNLLSALWTIIWLSAPEIDPDSNFLYLPYFKPMQVYGSFIFARLIQTLSDANQKRIYPVRHFSNPWPGKSPNFYLYLIYVLNSEFLSPVISRFHHRWK